jgi:hypothetical protein
MAATPIRGGAQVRATVEDACRSPGVDRGAAGPCGNSRSAGSRGRWVPTAGRSRLRYGTEPPTPPSVTATAATPRETGRDCVRRIASVRAVDSLRTATALTGADSYRRGSDGLWCVIPTDHRSVVRPDVPPARWAHHGAMSELRPVAPFVALIVVGSVPAQPTGLGPASWR